MQIDLRDSFLDTAYDLPKEIGKKAWKAIRLLSSNPESAGLNLERLRGKSEGLWSIRVDQKYRIILVRALGVSTLLFVGAEPDAYLFAERVARPSNEAAVQESRPDPRVALTTTVSPIQKSRRGKYLPLATHLLNLGEILGAAQFTFIRLEELLQADLPASARKYRAWWSNDVSHIQAAAWLAVGWRVTEISLTTELVIFQPEL